MRFAAMVILSLAFVGCKTTESSTPKTISSQSCACTSDPIYDGSYCPEGSPESINLVVYTFYNDDTSDIFDVSAIKLFCSANAQKECEAYKAKVKVCGVRPTPAPTPPVDFGDSPNEGGNFDTGDTLPTEI